jgi:hypothetical protein
MIAFTQLLVAGVGLAGRIHQAQQVQVVEKVVTKVITVAAPAPPPPITVAPPGAALPPPLPLAQTTPLPPPRAIQTPAIADPQVERLVNEARKARIAGDFGAAIMKLDQARDIAPREPNTLYEQGLVFEDMAAADPRLADQAADAFQEVYKLGVTGAGSLYQMAGRKLSEGIQLPDAMRGQLSLGRPRIFKDDDYREGERVVVTVPIRSAPGAEIVANKIETMVQFYDSTPKDGIQPAGTLCQHEEKWVTAPVDFADGEELLQVTYILPTPTEQQVHLFGKRKYYGQVVTLIYNGEVIDSYAWPRHLASQSSIAAAQQQQQQVQPMDDPSMAPDFLREEDIVDQGSVLPVKPGAGPQKNVAPINPVERGSSAQKNTTPLRPVEPTPLPR